MNTIGTKARPTTFNTLVATMVPLKHGDENGDYTATMVEEKIEENNGEISQNQHK